MRFYQRVGLIIGYEGISGLCRRVTNKVLGTKPPPPPSADPRIQEEHERLVKEFNAKAVAMGYEDPTNFYWYHTIDLGNGLVTPGDYDYRDAVPLFQFPADMRGMNVLDIGSATGFFAFEFEKRGANVVSVELPSIADWDMPTGEVRDRTLKELMEYHKVNNVKDVTYRHMHGPFEFCRKALNSKVRRCYATVYDLTKEKLGVDGFDLVFMGDILIHIFAPLKALATVAPLCRRTLIVAQNLAPVYDGSVPVLHYVAGDGQGDAYDNRTWSVPNWLCMEQMLRRVGFKNVSLMGYHHVCAKTAGFIWDRPIIHATK